MYLDNKTVAVITIARLALMLSPAKTVPPISNDKQKKNLSTVGNFMFERENTN